MNSIGGQWIVWWLPRCRLHQLTYQSKTEFYHVMIPWAASLVFATSQWFFSKNWLFSSTLSHCKMNTGVSSTLCGIYYTTLHWSINSHPLWVSTKCGEVISGTIAVTWRCLLPGPPPYNRLDHGSVCSGLGQTGGVLTDAPYKVLSLKDTSLNQVTNYYNFTVYLWLQITRWLNFMFIHSLILQLYLWIS